MPVANVVFSCLGHLYVHLFTAYYFVIVLALEHEWSMPYHELIGLWTLPSLLLGVAALPAGMLADRIGSTRMMCAFFIGMGASSMLAAGSDSPEAMLACLLGIGLFGAIYHPVGIPWLVRSAGTRGGRALGFNGVFGALGTAAAGITAGALIDAWSWRMAFLIPGIASVATGAALAWANARGAIDDSDRRPGARSVPSRGDMQRTLLILFVTMFVGGLVYHGTQTALPKMFEQRHEGLAGAGTFGIGLLVAIVYTAAGVMQIAGGYLADRLPLKSVYVGALVVQVPLLWLAGDLGGAALVGISTFMVMAAVAALPAENMLLARYTPEHRHGLVFGVKFVLAFAAAPIAVQIVANVTERTGEFFWVFGSFAFLGALAVFAAVWLPRSAGVVWAPGGRPVVWAMPPRGSIWTQQVRGTVWRARARSVIWIMPEL